MSAYPRQFLRPQPGHLEGAPAVEWSVEGSVPCWRFTCALHGLFMCVDHESAVIHSNEHLDCVGPSPRRVGVRAKSRRRACPR